MTDRSPVAGDNLALVRSHLANERTHLAHLRTALALMAFGLTLNRFAIYLIEREGATSTERPLGLLFDAKWVGFGMVLLGVLMVIWAAWRFHRVAGDIDRGRYRSSWRAVMTMTVAILLMGAATTVWLFFG